MLAATARLRRRDDFSATVAGGRRARRGTVVVHVAARRPEQPRQRTPADRPSIDFSADGPAGGDEPTSRRAGFVVSKAVGGAVVRNRVRRRLRELMRSRLDGLPPGTDVVVRALPATAAISYRELGADLDAALGTALQDAIRPARGAGDRGRP